MALRGGPHERCLALVGLFAVYVSAVAEQQVHRVEISRARGSHQNRFAVGRRARVWIGARFEQLLDNSRIAQRRGFR